MNCLDMVMVDTADVAVMDMAVGDTAAVLF